MKKRMPRRRRVVRRRRAPVRKYQRGGHIKEYASAQYSTLSQNLSPSQSQPGGLAYSFRNFSLAAASTRVLNIASAYQEYRIKKITWEVRGFFDSFVAPSSATAPTVPHLYWRVDKLGTYSTDTSLTTLKASGCKPIRLDDKLIRKSFKPAVLQGVFAEATPGAPTPPAQSMVVGSYKISPWLPTNANAYSSTSDAWAASSIDHLGLILALDCDVIPFGGPAATVSFTVEYEFRKPLDDLTTGATVESVKIETLAPQYVPPTEESK